MMRFSFGKNNFYIFVFYIIAICTLAFSSNENRDFVYQVSIEKFSSAAIKFDIIYFISYERVKKENCKIVRYIPCMSEEDKQFIGNEEREQTCVDDPKKILEAGNVDVYFFIWKEYFSDADCKISLNIGVFILEHRIFEGEKISWTERNRIRGALVYHRKEESEKFQEPKFFPYGKCFEDDGKYYVFGLVDNFKL